MPFASRRPASAARNPPEHPGDGDIEDLCQEVGTASIRDLVAHLALCRDQLGNLRAAAFLADPAAVRRARSTVLTTQSELVRELRRRSGE
jgi:hypothetical protein